MPSHAAAVRELLRRGLASENSNLAESRKRSSSFGVADQSRTNRSAQSVASRSFPDQLQRRISGRRRSGDSYRSAGLFSAIVWNRTLLRRIGCEADHQKVANGGFVQIGDGVCSAVTFRRLQSIFDLAWLQVEQKGGRSTFPWAIEASRYMLAQLVLAYCRGDRSGTR
jgi:hypothetical protein